MNQDEIIRMAMKAGLPTVQDTGEILGLNSAIRFAVLVAAAEREACAKVAEEWQLGIDDPKYQTDCAFAIRARGQE
jgi:hypothetical protein